MHEKVDNGQLDTKLLLRRYFLDRYHPDRQQPLRVIDCCAGDSVIWREIRRERTGVIYMGMDEKHKPGTLRVDSRKVISAGGWRADVVDIDTYGSPWGHWDLVLRTMPAGFLTVFLTMGSGMSSTGGSMSSVAKRALGIDRLTHLPASLTWLVNRASIKYCLALAGRHGVEIVEAQEGVPPLPWPTHYYGLRIVKQPTNST